MIVLMQTDFPDPVAPAIEQMRHLGEIVVHLLAFEIAPQHDRQDPAVRAEFGIVDAARGS